MKELYFRKAHGQNVIPADEQTAAFVDRWPPGSAKKIKIVGEVRNLQFHRKFFKMLNVAFENLPESLSFPSFETFRESVLISSGHYELFHIFIDGVPHEVRKAKSISFAKMDQEEFNKLYNKVHQTLCDNYGQNYVYFVDTFM